MNILYLNNSMHLGGDNKCILKLCKELKKDNKIIVASMGGILESELNNLGIMHYKIHDVVNKKPSIIISNVYKLIKIVKDENIDIIHSHHRMSALTAKIVSKFVKVKVIHTQHLCIEDKFRLTKFALNSIKIITVSESAKKILQTKSKLNGNRITTIYNTIETENDNKVVDKRLINLKDQGYFIIAQVSRIIDYKGVYDFVDIAKKTVIENDNIRFVLIGDGPEKENLEKYIKKERLQDFIILLGSKDNVIEHLKYIDLLLLCSYIEGLPLAPIEAFSQGIPVIATNINGTNEEIVEGMNGHLVNVKDIDQFSNRILELYKDREKLIEMKINSKNIFNKYFSSDEYISEHIKIYCKG
ncbi:glycosyltransferase family 4 protein [Romboutsia lituseburensis]|uniref:Glycosyltransferase involved in cell wall bisynthesis n=1 Tax=Romboutsia lituseburensis DSM 797 TaxID=1121325 RepID=A0A1G9PIE2_9FIRM|nr:glycosyltransferase family 4 protein [Romboutsia lituseburensis]CEH33394.1 Glycosyl transferase, group 1 [Romboutsia lituseburensis]SDL98313.1 Glycosyltransferase involved in cell wall bisynthesis [Romboutsia lituseburensis DSM 797]